MPSSSTTARQAEARLLVVDDEPNIRELLSASLRYAGFEVQTATTGAEALRVARSFRPDLLVLDVMMPGLDGFAVASTLRSKGDQVPVLFLTARDGTEDKVTGLTIGGDDYVTKPFSLEELVARVRTVLRRTGRADPDGGRLVVADLELDEEAHEVTRAGRPVTLTATEFRLLRYLMSNPRRVLGRGRRTRQAAGDMARPRRQ